MSKRGFLERVIERAEDVVRRAEEEDEEALEWCSFINLTIVSILVIGAVLIAWIWL